MIASWIGLVGGILGLAGLAGATFAVLRSSLTRSTIKLYQENTAAQAERIDLLESALEAEKKARADDVARLELARSSCEERLKTMEVAYDVLVHSLRVMGSQVVDTVTTTTTQSRPKPKPKKRS